MSSSQRRTNPNNQQRQYTNQPPQVFTSNPYDDYIDDSSWTPPNQPVSFNPVDQSSYMYNGDYIEEPYDNVINPNPGIETYYYGDDDESPDNDKPTEIEVQLDAEEKVIINAHSNHNNGDVAVYSDDVQNAFANYENENAHYWMNNKAAWNTFSNDEQDEMFDQMRECMLAMADEYPISEVPSNVNERTQENLWNLDAPEFQPSWSSPSIATTTTDKTPTAVTSLSTDVIKEEQKQQH